MRKMHLVAYLKTGPTASYASAWRHPSAPLHDIWDAERYEHLARLLEHARFDAGFFAGLPVRAPRRGSWCAAIHHSARNRVRRSWGSNENAT